MSQGMFWLTALIDLPGDRFEEGVRFWEQVTGFHRSRPGGELGEYVDLVPPHGHHHLVLQRLGEGPARLHLDLHVEDPDAAADRAAAAGARIEQRHALGYVVMSSPGGFTFCFVDTPAATPATPIDWGDGLRSAVDQVCLDVPAPAYDAEVTFWATVTGWERRLHPEHDEFQWLVPGDPQPMQLLLQRLGERSGPVRAHVDLPCTDRRRETERHLACGAEVLAVHAGWTVLQDPVGAFYCLTDRSPETRVPGTPAGR